MAKINRNWDKMTPDELLAFTKNVVEKCTGNPIIPQDSPEFLQLKASLAAAQAKVDELKALEAQLREARKEARKAQARYDADVRAVYKQQRP